MPPIGQCTAETRIKRPLAAEINTVGNGPLRCFPNRPNCYRPTMFHESTRLTNIKVVPPASLCLSKQLLLHESPISNNLYRRATPHGTHSPRAHCLGLPTSSLSSLAGQSHGKIPRWHTARVISPLTAQELDNSKVQLSSIACDPPVAKPHHSEMLP